MMEVLMHAVLAARITAQMAAAVMVGMPVITPTMAPVPVVEAAVAAVMAPVPVVEADGAPQLGSRRKIGKGRLAEQLFQMATTLKNGNVHIARGHGSEILERIT